MNIKRGKSNNNTLLTEEPPQLYSLGETGGSLLFHCETVFAYFPDFAPFCDIKNDVLHERNKGKLKAYDYTISAFLRTAQTQRTGQPLTSHTSARKCEQGHNKQKREWVKRSVRHFNCPSVPCLMAALTVQTSALIINPDSRKRHKYHRHKCSGIGDKKAKRKGCKWERGEG